MKDKFYNKINFVKYHSKKYGLIFGNDDEEHEILLDDVDAKALAGKMLMLIEVRNIKTAFKKIGVE